MPAPTTTTSPVSAILTGLVAACTQEREHSSINKFVLRFYIDVCDLSRSACKCLWPSHLERKCTLKLHAILEQLRATSQLPESQLPLREGELLLSQTSISPPHSVLPTPVIAVLYQRTCAQVAVALQTIHTPLLAISLIPHKETPGSACGSKTFYQPLAFYLAVHKNIRGNIEAKLIPAPALNKG